MNVLDWLVVIVYIVVLLTLSRYLSRRQDSVEDYYLGGRSLPWWTIGLSTMATQLGAISFISAPAFVALKPGGGLTWLGYEFAVPAAVIFVMIFIIPVIHAEKVVSVYEYLERRFDPATRSIVSFIFQIGRGLATGVSIYAIGLVLSAVWKFPLVPTILAIGVVTVIYDVWGGIKAVVFSDVIQMVILTAGILICGIAAYNLTGGWENVFSAFEKERLEIMRLSTHGFGDGDDFSFWALLLGGFFLYISYYGCDQSQIQREICAKTLDDAKRSLMLNGIARFFIVSAYLAMGLLIGAFAYRNEYFMSLIPKDKVDYMVPVFVLNYLPHGLIGFIVVALLAAFMSSLDSSINSLSAATMRDIYQRYVRPEADGKHYFLWSKILTVFWGAVCTGFAFFVGSISDTIIEAINKVGSLFYGPVLAAFVLGILIRRTSAAGAKAGVLAGVSVNLILWIGFPGVSWLWWNVTGCLSAIGTGYLLSFFYPNKKIAETSGRAFADEGGNWRRGYIILVLYFFAIIFLSYAVQRLWLG
ncbi:MAG: sodium:solute symporter [Deltaproteobacteria bacterium]